MTTTLENLNYQIKHVRDPLKTKSTDWRETADQWYVTFKTKDGFFTVDYYTGSGHRKEKHGRSFAVKPDIKNIIHSLYMDSMAADANFHDWCLNFGYSDDSIQALNTYKECLQSAVNLRKLGMSKEYLDGIFENY